MDKLIFGFSVTVLGMLVVFFGLIILILCVSGLGMLTKAGEKRRIKVVNETVSEERKEDGTTPRLEASETGGVPDEVMAAITAAVAAVWQGEKGFVVRHVKRIQNAPPWNRAGRQEQTYSRF